MARSAALVCLFQVSLSILFVSISAQSDDDFCKDKPKGDYLDPHETCSGKVYTCKGDGTLLKRQCPGDLVFDTKNASCTRKEHVEACRNTTSSMSSTAYNPSTAVESSTKYPDLHIDDSDDFCSNKTKGDYLDPHETCSGKVYTCKSDGTLLKRNCPGELVFNEKTSSCTRKEHVEACQNKTTSSLSTPDHLMTSPDHSMTSPDHSMTSPDHSMTSPDHSMTSPDHSMTSPDHSMTSTDHSMTTVGIITSTEFTCSNRSKGYYIDTRDLCSGRFFKCADDGKLLPMQCPEGFIFEMGADVQHASCIANSTASCAANEMMTSRMVEQSSSSYVTASHVTSKSDSTAESLSTGHDIVMGSTDILSTTSKDHSIMMDTDGDVTSTSENATDIKMTSTEVMPTSAYDNISTVYIPTVYVMATTGKHHGINDSTSDDMMVSTEVSPTSPKSEFSCDDLPTGNYPDPDKPCSSHFFTCTSDRRKFNGSCDPELVFDVVLNQCNTIDFVSGCGNASSEKTTIDPFCENKTAGHYPDPNSNCSQMFYACTEDKVLTVRWCPFFEYYAGDNTCLAFDEVPGCKNSTVSDHNQTSTTVEGRESSTVALKDSTTVTGIVGSSISVKESSTISVKESSTISVKESSTIPDKESSTISGTDRSTIVTGKETTTVEQETTWPPLKISDD